MINTEHPRPRGRGYKPWQRILTGMKVKLAISYIEKNDPNGVH